MTAIRRLAASLAAVLLLALATPQLGGGARAQGAPVTATPAEMAPIVHRVRLSGTVVAPRSAGVSTDLGGLVQTMQVALGDRVEAGAPLVQLDASLAELELRRTEAATREAREELADAERRLEVGRRLAQRNNLPQNELDTREAQVRIARAKVDRLEAEEATQRERVRRHTIAAPFAGVVARKVTEAGEWVTPGATVVELVETDNLRVDVPVPQSYFPELQEEPAVTLQFDALPGREFGARVAARVPVSDPASRSFTLRLRPTAEDIPLTPGMSARVTLQLATGEQGLVISRDAVIRYPDGRTTVWVVQDQDDKTVVEERQVTLGRAFDGQVHVRQGLEEGARVVVRGNESLQPGQRVRLTDAAS